MSFINSLPAQQQQQQQQLKPAQAFSSSSTSYLKRKTKHIEKGKQYAKEMQEKNDKLVKKKQNKVVYGLSILPSILAYCFAAGMNHTPPIQDLPPEPCTWKEVMDHPMIFLKYTLRYMFQLPTETKDKEWLWSA